MAFLSLASVTFVTGGKCFLVVRQGLREHLDLPRSLLVTLENIVAVILWGQKVKYKRLTGKWVFGKWRQWITYSQYLSLNGRIDIDDFVCTFLLR